MTSSPVTASMDPQPPPAPKFEVVGGNLVPETEPGESWVGDLSQAFGIKDMDATVSMMGQLIGANFKLTASNCRAINGLLAQVTEMGPRDASETMLIMQMVTCHTQVMNLMKTVTDNGTSLKAEAAQETMKMVERMMRIYTKQMETLAQYRRKGEQKMTVEHITVNSGGQAIVGNLDNGRSHRGE